MNNNKKTEEYTFKYNDESCRVKLNIISEEIKNEDSKDEQYQTVIYEPFFVKSSLTKTEYKNNKTRAFQVLESALKQKFNSIKLRNFNNTQRFENFKEFTGIKDNEIAKEEYIYLNHALNDYIIGDKMVSEIWKKLGCLEKTTAQKNILSDSQFNLTWKYFVELMTKNNCKYCGISIKQINELSDKKQLKTKRARGYTLEVDQKDPFLFYSDDNCVASCYWCNNAKTDEFSASEFKTIAKGINETWNKRLQEIKSSEIIPFQEDAEIWKKDAN